MRLLVLIACLWGFGEMCGQGVGEKLPFPSQGHQFYLGIGGYLHTPRVELGNNAIERSLTPRADARWTIEPIDLMWFPEKNWGISASVRINQGMQMSERVSAITDIVAERFGNQYDISTIFNPQNPVSQSSSVEVSWFRFGLCYRVELKQWILMPRLSLSWTSFVNPDQEFIMKEQGSNIWSNLKYEATDANPWFRSVSPAFWLGRPLSNRFVLFTQVSYERPLADISYTERVTNLFSSEISEENFTIKKQLNTVFWGVGITFRMQGFVPRRDW